MRVIDKREEDKREEWHVGDIIRFGNYTVNENYGMIVHIRDSSDSINLITLKEHQFQRGSTGFYMYPSTTALKEKIYELYRFVENMGNADIGEVFSQANNANKYDRDDILMCKYQISDKDFDLYEIKKSSNIYIANILHTCRDYEKVYPYVSTASSTEELVDLLKDHIGYEIVEKVPAYIVLGEFKNKKIFRFSYWNYCFFRCNNLD